MPVVSWQRYDFNFVHTFRGGCGCAELGWASRRAALHRRSCRLASPAQLASRPEVAGSRVDDGGEAAAAKHSTLAFFPPLLRCCGRSSSLQGTYAAQVHPLKLLPTLALSPPDNAAMMYSALAETPWAPHARLLLMTGGGLALGNMSRALWQPLSPLRLDSWADASTRLLDDQVGARGTRGRLGWNKQRQTVREWWRMAGRGAGLLLCVGGKVWQLAGMAWPASSRLPTGLFTLRCPHIA